MSDRSALVADAAIAIVATDGMRELTHRSVDHLAGLPIGSTSNVFRTRQRLLIGAAARVATRVREMSGRAPSDDAYLAALVGAGNHTFRALAVMLLDGSSPLQAETGTREALGEITETMRRLSGLSAEAAQRTNGVLLMQTIVGGRDVAEVKRVLTAV